MLENLNLEERWSVPCAWITLYLKEKWSLVLGEPAHVCSMADGMRLNWTPAEEAVLIAAVASYWYVAAPGDARISWASIASNLPGRTIFSCEQRARALRTGAVSQVPPVGGQEGAGGGGSAGEAWTAHEHATLLAAMSLRRGALEIPVSWQHVHDGAPLLAGRSTASLYNKWRSLSGTPAVLAAVAQFEAGMAQRSSASASAPLAPATLSPFSLLHSLRSAGSIDEQTLRVCWEAAAKAV